jgi:FkbM family methyltransferase
LNAIERFADRLHPRVSTGLRLLKSKWRRDATLRLVNQLVRPGDVAIDVGAYRGIWTARLSKLVGRTGHVHAIEPVPANVAVLESVYGRKSNVTIHPVALSDHADHLELYVPVFDGHRVTALSSLAPRDVPHDVMEVQVRPLDELFDDGSQRVDFIKCDVEGHELEVLRGASRILERSRPALVVEIEQRHRQGSIEETFDYLERFGYEGYCFMRDGLRPIQEFDLHEHQLKHLSSELNPYGMPGEYVNNFFFPRPGTDVARLLVGR